MQPVPRCAALLRQPASRRAGAALRCSSLRPALRGQTRHASGPEQFPRSDAAVPQRRGGGRFLGVLAIFTLSAGAAYYLYPTTKNSAAPDVLKKSKPKKEKKPSPAPSGEQAVANNPQQDQRKQSWEHPGVYLWGSNAGKVIAPDSNEAIIKSPRRIPFFNGKLLRAMKLRHDFGAAITEEGNLVLWGGGMSPTEPEPVTVLQGKDLVKLAVSADRAVAVSSRGAVYSVPVSRQDQLTGHKIEVKESSWLPFWSSKQNTEPINYRVLTPQALKSGEKVVDVRCGLEHCVMLTSKGRVFTAAASTIEFPAKGQLGVPGLTWATRPAGAYDQAHEVETPSPAKIVEIAAGDQHSALLDSKGKLYVFGDNTFGQLGFATGGSNTSFDKPTELEAKPLYENTDYDPKITSVAAGGLSTFFTVDTNQSKKNNGTAANKDAPVRTADVWACGNGVYGTLGNGKFIHASSRPSKVKGLSSVFEYDERAGKLTPLRIGQLSVGATHASAVIANATKNFGSDVLFWGGNEYYQLGTGKRKNVHTPVYVAGLDSKEESRLQVAPRQSVRIGEGSQARNVSMEQRVECGGLVTGIYSAT